MVKNLVIGLFLVATCMGLKAQGIQNVLKYSTFYISGTGSTPIDASPEYFVDQNSEIREITKEYSINYNISIGLRKIARFDYEQKQNQFYDGQTESTVSVSSNIGAVKGLEYLAQFDIGRQQGYDYNNQRYFVRYLGDRTLTKIEYRNNGLVDLNYLQIDARFRQKNRQKVKPFLGSYG